MQTRSQTKQPLEKFVPNSNQPLEKVVPNILLLKKVVPKLPLLKVDIDFDGASSSWKMNKKSLGNGCYKYICVKITKTGKQCKNDSIRNCEFCRFHNK
jgi:hypothetical protein